MGDNLTAYDGAICAVDKYGTICAVDNDGKFYQDGIQITSDIQGYISQGTSAKSNYGTWRTVDVIPATDYSIKLDEDWVNKLVKTVQDKSNNVISDGPEIPKWTGFIKI
jgi:hypothetical protein